MTSLLESLIAVIAPHCCKMCGKENNIVCTACLPELCNLANSECFLCAAPTLDFATCQNCCSNTPLQYVWVSGEYEKDLQGIIKSFKFEGARAGAQPLAEILQASLPQLPSDMLIVPIPTAQSRIRIRGYDQTALLAKELARLVNRPYVSLLHRNIDNRQLGSTRSLRQQQAQQAFKIKTNIDKPVLLVDDVVTTGATINAAAQLLYKAGSPVVWATTIARQSSSKTPQYMLK